MGPTVVVDAEPLCDDTRGVLLGFEAMTMNALLFQRSDDPFDHAVLLRAVRGDELLTKTITTHEARIGSRGKNEPIVRPQQERVRASRTSRSTLARAPTSPSLLCRFFRAASQAVLAYGSRWREPRSASHHGPPRRGRGPSPVVRSVLWRPTAVLRYRVDIRWVVCEPASP